MFGSVLRDVYRETEKAELRAALEDLCSPKDYLFWSSTGLYAYFDPYPRANDGESSRLLYVGLAGDIPDRFAAHNGFKGKRTRGNKRLQIEKWFREHELLGLAVLPQSPLAQANTYRERSALSRTFRRPKTELISQPTAGQDAISILEGHLIEAHKLLEGSEPPWNAVGGSVAGQRLADHGSGHLLLPMIDGRVDSLLCARRPIRSLSDVASFGFFESEVLHVARTNAIAFATLGATDLAIAEQLQRMESSPHYSSASPQIGHMLDTGYLRNHPVVEPFDVIRWATHAAP